MHGTRLVAAAFGVVITFGTMLATAAPAAAEPGSKISASASSTCSDRDKVIIKVTVKNRERHPVFVVVDTRYGSERAYLRDGAERTLSIRTDRSSVNGGTATVTARKQSGGSTTVRPTYRGQRCDGDPRISVTPRDRNHNHKIDGVKVTNNSPFAVRVRVLVGRQQESGWLRPGGTLEMKANDTQRSGVAIATRRDDGRLHSTTKVFRA